MAAIECEGRGRCLGSGYSSLRVCSSLQLAVRQIPQASWRARSCRGRPRKNWRRRRFAFVKSAVIRSAVVDPSGLQQVVIRGDAAPAHALSVARTSAGLRLNALAERCKDGPPDHGASPKTFAHHQLVVQIRQAIEWNARIPMVLEVIADIARQEEDRLEPGGYRREGD